MKELTKKESSKKDYRQYFHACVVAEMP